MGKDRLQSLDGLRAVAIMFVLVWHTLLAIGNTGLKTLTGDLGNLGVRVFFVISGFIITRLLLLEFESKGTISIKGFYVRRILRIFPAFYTFLIVMFVLHYFGLITISIRSFGYAATYLINYLSVEDRGWYLGHIWSLAVEEQFYLLWPLSFLLLGTNRAIILLLAVILVVPMVRYISWDLRSGDELIKWAFHTVCDSLAAGCLLALVRSRLHGLRLYKSWVQSFWPMILPLIIVYVNAVIVGRPRVSYLFGQSLMNLGIALFIDYAISNNNSVIHRVLNGRIMVRIGVLSYSIYLWQQFFLVRSSDIWIQEFPQNLLFMAGAAFCSYYLIERAFLLIKERLYGNVLLNARRLS